MELGSAHPVTEMSIRMFLVVKSGRSVMLTSPISASHCSRKCGNLDFSTPWPVTRIILLFFLFLFNFLPDVVKVSLNSLLPRRMWP
jgi:hypothetical protein